MKINENIQIDFNNACSRSFAFQSKAIDSSENEATNEFVDLSRSQAIERSIFFLLLGNEIILTKCFDCDHY